MLMPAGMGWAAVYHNLEDTDGVNEQNTGNS